LVSLSREEEEEEKMSETLKQKKQKDDRLKNRQKKAVKTGITTREIAPAPPISV